MTGRTGPVSGSNTDLLLIDDTGRPYLYAGPELRDDLPPDILEGLTRRRLVALGHDCPCGARLVLPSRAERRAAAKRKPNSPPMHRVRVEHEDDCPALHPDIDAAARGRAS
jgi:hypothetical protein